MRIVISKLVRERSHSLDGILSEQNLGMDATGESFRAEFRTLDMKPFGFEGYGSLEIDRETFDGLKPGTIYNLTLTEWDASWAVPGRLEPTLLKG